MRKIFYSNRILPIIAVNLLFLVFAATANAQASGEFTVTTTKVFNPVAPDGTATVSFSGETNLVFEYAVDEYDFQLSNYFEHLYAGEHVVKMRVIEDGVCTCETCIITLRFIIEIPDSTYYRDADGDGYGNFNNSIYGDLKPQGYVSNGTDCNDQDASIHPGATEICNGKDNNCNGQGGEGCTTHTFHRDADGDGYGITGSGQTVPSDIPVPPGYVYDNSDCNDENAAIHPGAAEIPDDDLDNNCDGVFATTHLRYIDNDLDGYGSSSFSIGPDLPGDYLGFTYVYNYGDCNDNVTAIHPLATDICDGLDNDCDLFVDEDEPPKTYTIDNDGDGYPPYNYPLFTGCTVPPGYIQITPRPFDKLDCDDGNPAVHGFAPELCDGKDNNCNGIIDELCPKQDQTITMDAIPDKMADDAPFAINATATSGLPVKFTLVTYPQGVASLNDNNITLLGEGEAIIVARQEGNDRYKPALQVIGNFLVKQKHYYYADNDGDGYGNPAISFFDVSPPEGYVKDNADFDDADLNSYPGAPELCDDKDNNNDGAIDEGLEKFTYYRDVDGDGYGGADSKDSCSAPKGYVLAGDDCNDNSPFVFPNAGEVCNGKDESCNGQIDEGVPKINYYKDADGDGFGDPSISVLSCSRPVGYVTGNTDCNDSDPSVNPDDFEVCDGVDNDCDGQTDEGYEKSYYPDTDGDGYGAKTAAVNGTYCNHPDGYVTNNLDCNDGNASVYPGATEVTNGIDDDCDGQTDEDALITFYKDYDKDGYGNSNSTVQASTAPKGYVAVSGDCNDSKNTIYPGAPELCDNLDNDCDGLKDEGLPLKTFFKDYDKDGFGSNTVSVQACTAPAGYVAVSGDCNDAKNSINPGAPEIADNLDNDCDGSIDEGFTQITFYRDYDKDTYGNNSVTVLAASAPAGYVAAGNDCNDNRNTVYPGASERCDNLDNDCDGLIDEGLALTTFYKDYDKDGFGNGGSTVQACIAPAGYVVQSGDCNDAKNTIYPGATELCDNLDNDCDGVADEGYTLKTFYKDYDKDGYGSKTVTVQACTAPAGYTSATGDCNDAKSAVNPGATEVVNGIDDNCNGVIDESVMTVSVRGSAVNEAKPVLLTVTAVPNPSKRYFTLNIQSGSNKPLRIRVFHAFSYLVEERSNMVPGRAVRLGESYRPGVYLVEVVQGSERRMLKLVKQSD